MSTKTKRPAAKVAAKKTNGKKAASSRRPEIMYLRTASIPLSLIDPSPFQPRLQINPDDLNLLAHAVDTAGFLDAVWLREKGERYELLDGERRWRAAEIAKLDEVRADIFSASDAQARQMALLSVVHREDLSPIERATAYQGMLDQGDYPDQKALAAAMGVDQSTVSNLVRLLKLPEDWRRRIISREISERHARALLPFIKYPTIVAAFDEFFVQNLDTSDNSTLPAVSEWEEETVPQVVKDCTRSMDGMHGDRMLWHPRYGRVSIFEPDAFQEKQLKILKFGSGDQAEHLATNVELWEELQKAHLEEEGKKGRAPGTLGRGAEETGGLTTPLAASSADYDGDDDADRNAADGDDAGRADENGDKGSGALDGEYREMLLSKVMSIYQRHVKGQIKLAPLEVEFCQTLADLAAGGLVNARNRDKALDLVEEYWKASDLGPVPPNPMKPPAAGGSDFYRWKLAWMRKLIAEELSTCEFVAVVKILTLGLAVWKIAQADMEQVLYEALRGNVDFSRRKGVSEHLLAAQDYQLEKVLAKFVSDWFWREKDGPTADVPAEDVERLIDLLGVDLDGEWRGGNILAPQALLELYDDAGLRDLAKKWKVAVGEDWNRKGLLGKLEQALGDETLNLGLPAEVAKARAKR